MYSSISRNVLLQKYQEQHSLIMRNCSLFSDKPCFENNILNPRGAEPDYNRYNVTER